MKAELDDYSDINASASGNISYETPCSTPDDLTYEGQGDPTTVFNYAYDGSILTVQAPKFTATPDVCEITYTCKSVSNPASVSGFACNTLGVTTFDAAT